MNDNYIFTLERTLPTYSAGNNFSIFTVHHNNYYLCPFKSFFWLDILQIGLDII